VLQVDLSFANKVPESKGNESLEEVQRNYILQIMERTNWRVRGEGGAAEILRLAPTTLESRMEKLGIMRPN
jgi:transcriptional regulator with GAF, ATPase, and Fis domain